jgi:hypothetical protein
MRSKTNKIKRIKEKKIRNGKQEIKVKENKRKGCK